jgi:carboxymethylenebutenolidase
MNRALIGIVVALVASLALAQTPPAAKPPEKAPPPKSNAKRTIPADSDNATKALLDSPRHGEWVEISLADPAAPKLKTWVSYPERKDAAPVVIVIHEIFGMTDWVRGVADQLAAEGFIAIAPDLLSGKGPNGGASDSFKGDAVRDAIMKLDGKDVIAMLNATRDYAAHLPSAAQKSGTIGFCWGGTTSFNYAVAQPKLNAAVVCYGTGPNKDALSKLEVPVLGLYGGDDNRVTSTVEPTKAQAAELKKSYDPHVYAGAGHGFFRQQTGKDGANEKAAREGWAEAVKFLKKNLETTSPPAK